MQNQDQGCRHLRPGKRSYSTFRLLSGRWIWGGGTAGLYGADLGWLNAVRGLRVGDPCFGRASLCDNGFVFGVTVMGVWLA